MKRLIVGGAVRDLLLGRPVSDIDYLVLGLSAEELERRYPRAKRVGRTTPSWIIGGSEHALPRGDGIDADLALRDLTINALALDDDGELYAHPQAIEDLHLRVLRPAGPEAFRDDPLRVLRAARFAAQLPDFDAHPTLFPAMHAVCEARLLEGLPRERVAKEVIKVLAAPRPSRFFEFLRGAGCLRPWFNELAAAEKIPAGPAPFHDGDVLAHLLAVADSLAGDPVAVWMGICHDLGKTATPEEKWPRHHGHDALGAEIAAEFGERVGLPSRFILAGRVAAAEHMRAARYPELRVGTKVDLLARLHAARLTRETFRLVLADHGADLSSLALRDLAVILAVRLPAGEQNLGQRSGERLRELRCLALAEAYGQAPAPSAS